MSLNSLISSLKKHAEKFPGEKHASEQIIAWIGKHWEFAFVKENLDGHLTGSMMITNPARTKVLLMLHKKFQRWQQFGGHCDGEIDVRAVATREFHEESGISIEPEIIWDIFLVDIYDIPLDAKWRPPHHHSDIMYLGVISEDTPFIRQESEVDDIWWFDIEGIEKYVTSGMVQRIQKIKNFS
jgi:8-oxo-dGTP pyrophosphatase MutT (NUDIX family)